MKDFIGRNLFAEADDDKGGGGGEPPFIAANKDDKGKEPPFNPVKEPPKDDGPDWSGVKNADKYKGKSPVEIARMHQELEALLGRKDTEHTARIEAILRDFADAGGDGDDDPKRAPNGKPKADPPKTGRDRVRTARRPDPNEDPEGYEDWLVDRAADRLRAEQAAKDSNVAWDSFFDEIGVDRAEREAKLAEVTRFFENPANLTPARLWSAMHLDELLQARESGAARSLQVALDRVSGAQRTTIGDRRADAASEPKDVKAQIRALVSQGRMQEADALVRKVYDAR